MVLFLSAGILPTGWGLKGLKHGNWVIYFKL